MDTGKQRREQLKREGTLHPNPQKVRTELVAQSPFFDAHDLIQMKYEMLRSVSADHQPAAAAAGRSAYPVWLTTMHAASMKAADSRVCCQASEDRNIRTSSTPK